MYSPEKIRVLQLGWSFPGIFFVDLLEGFPVSLVRFLYQWSVVHEEKVTGDPRLGIVTHKSSSFAASSKRSPPFHIPCHRILAAGQDAAACQP